MTLKFPPHIVTRAILTVAIALVLLSDAIGKEVKVYIPPIDSESAGDLYNRLLALLGPVVLKQTISTVRERNSEVETFFLHLGNGNYKTVTAEAPLSSDTSLPEQQKERLVSGHLRNSQGSFIFSPTLQKWTQDPFTQKHHDKAMNLAGVKWNLAHVLIDTISFEMRRRKAYEKASLEARSMGDEQRARTFAEYSREIQVPGNVYSELDKGYESSKWTDFRIAPNGLVLEATKREANAEGKIVEKVANEIIPAFSFDLPAADLPAQERVITSRKVDASEWEITIIGLELMEDERSIRISAVYKNSPAAEAGVRNGDELLSIDGNSDILNSDQARKLIAASETPKLVLSRSGKQLSITLNKVRLRNLIDSSGRVQFEGLLDVDE